MEVKMGTLGAMPLFTLLNQLLDRLEALSACLGLASAAALKEWDETLRKQVITRFNPGFPLTVAITGGGSAGKSSLFNALCQENVSPVGGKAGMNRRVLAAIHPDQMRIPGFLEALFSVFRSPPEAMRQKEDLTLPGPALYTVLETAQKRWVLLDTPDFDTGAQGRFTNREATESALAAADVLIYIFTNASYNNLENTTFISKILTSFGYRPCVLVYRTPAEIRTDMAMEHARTVARHIYGDQAQRHILGYYQVREDNLVSEGRRFMTPVPMTEGALSMVEEISAVDAMALRLRLYNEVLRRLSDFGFELLKEAKASTKWLSLYRDALEVSESVAIKKTLSHFPMDSILRKFAKAWSDTDPPHIKLMRRTGKVLDIPVKAMIRAGKWISKNMSDSPGPDPPPSSESEPLETDLVVAANRLRAQIAGPGIDIDLEPQAPLANKFRKLIEELDLAAPGLWKEVSQRPKFTVKTDAITFHIPGHPSLAEHRKDIQMASWAPTLNAIVSQKESILKLSGATERELHRLAEELRAKHDFWDHARQTAAAALNILPAAVAVTYILSTGDPVGAVGIKVKLASLFGIKDLYALVALPATSGFKAADQHQLETILGPIAQTWLNSRLAKVRDLFREQMTGPVLDAAKRIIEDANAFASEADSLLGQFDPIRKEMGSA